MPFLSNIPERSAGMVARQSPQIEILMTEAIVFHQQGKFQDAKSIYEKVLAIQPTNFFALQLMGALFVQTDNNLHAIDFLSRALQINPNHLASYINLGVALQKLNRFDEALASYDKAIGLDPNNAETYMNRGVALEVLNRLEEAIASYDKAISIKPNNAEAYLNRGIALQGLKRLDDALASYDKAIYIKPDSPHAHWNLSLFHLLSGNFEAGWRGYEWRWKDEEKLRAAGFRKFSQPLWLGEEPLDDKTILLHCEQGFGDTIQFCRYATLVAKNGAKVILEVQPHLVQLLTSLKGVNQIVAKGDKLPEFDYQCPLLSLPLAFRTILETIPTSFRYIDSDREKVAKWDAKLGKKTKPRVGIVWSGGTAMKYGQNRSLRLSQLIPYLSPCCEYVCLQKELRDIDKAILAESSHIKYFGNELSDFSDTAALCDLMDVVISIDTSVAHLAGSLGKVTWVLLHYASDWRWLLDREDSPWYPSVTLYRQAKIDEWDGVLERVKMDLEKLDQ